jgi:hypothetical protein
MFWNKKTREDIKELRELYLVVRADVSRLRAEALNFTLGDAHKKPRKKMHKRRMVRCAGCEKQFKGKVGLNRHHTLSKCTYE